MPKKNAMDSFGAVSLILFSAILGFNQVVIKVVNEGLQPAYFAGLRSVGGVLVLLLWMRWRGLSLRITPGTWWVGLIIGSLFALEFLFLFKALDLTTVVRSGVIFYSMPVWLALMSHFVLPGDRMSLSKACGLALAFAGVVFAIATRGDLSGGSLLGDLFALGAAVGWASTALMAKASRLRLETPEVQLMWQLAVSAPIMLGAALFFGPLVREFQPVLHLAGLGFQILLVSLGFVSWLWLLSIYPASGVASFSFLGPVFGVMFGWLILDEPVGFGIWAALVLVAAGLYLINRPARASVAQ
jgi:drug/metabolite transporter (DMT)-like permease